MRIPTSLAVLLAVVLTSAAPTKCQVTNNVLERVLHVRAHIGVANSDFETATAFTLDVDGREYLITAKHVVAGYKDEGTVDIEANGQWKPLGFKVFKCDDPVDIAVLIPQFQLTVNFDFANQGGVEIGQDAYFLGFPYNIGIPTNGYNGPYPMAIVKRGTFSAMIPITTVKNATQILLDGHNNPGFSGGPIVFRDFAAPGYVMRIIGVVSGFQPEVVPTMHEHTIPSADKASEKAKSEPWRINRRSDGTWFEYVDNGDYVPLNTGIVYGYGIQPALDLIAEHPIGPEVKELPGNNPFKQ